MSVSSQVNTNDFPHKLIGELLEEAGLISSPQLRTALKAQIKSSDFRLGEIIANRGWLQPRTIDFLVDVFSASNLHKYSPKQPIGYYLKEAGLLTGEQVESIVKDQQNLGIKFCYLAVLKGFLRPKTADFFLDHVAKRFCVTPTITHQQIHDRDKVQTVILANNIYEDISKDQLDYSLDCDGDVFQIHDRDIMSTPIYIDT